MQTFDAIKKRASIRKFKATPVAKELIEQMVDAGRRAPTARRVEPWEFVAIQDKKTLAELSRIAENGAFVKDAAGCIAVFCQDTKYYLEDGCGATENILLVCADLGLGACWIAGDKKNYVGEVASLLNVPAGIKLVSLIAFGYPDGEAKQTRERGLKDVIHWERW